MPLRRLLLTAALLLAVGASAAAQQEAPAVKTYEDSERGLTRLLEDALKSAQQDDRAALNAMMRALVLPQAEAWFQIAFGELLGERFARQYEDRKAALPLILARDLKNIAEAELTFVRVKRFSEPCDPQADGQQYPVLAAMQEFTPLYQADFIAHDGRKARTLWFFTYAGGAFRYLSRLPEPLFGWQAAPHLPRAPDPPGKRIRIGGKVQRAKLVNRVQPAYPSRARNQGIQGTVRLSAIIGKDGSLYSIQLVQGHCWLAEAAIDAVRQWRYTPTLLEGEPVEVVTTVDVVFTLN